ncbi:MAG: hypothetical protein IT285_15240 [Bdellovibrionales bacterium]|nr:hypothetical protein [Bdellovibrionales bacterium]
MTQPRYRHLALVRAIAAAAAAAWAAPPITYAVERVSGPLTVARVEFVQRQRSGNGREELVVQGTDPYSGRPAQAQLSEAKGADGGTLSACERYALIALNRPTRWQMTFALVAAPSEVASLETLQKDKAEWRVLRAELDRLGEAQAQVRCTLQPVTPPIGGNAK